MKKLHDIQLTSRVVHIIVISNTVTYVLEGIARYSMFTLRMQ